MRIDYLVLGNCQSQRLAECLPGSKVNYILSYPGLFSAVGVSEQKRQLIERFGEASATSFIKSGLLLPVPSLDDLSQYDPKEICCTIFHPRFVYDDGAGNYVGSNVDFESDVGHVNIGDFFAPHEPKESYVAGYASLLEDLQRLFPNSRISVVVRNSPLTALHGNTACWFEEWSKLTSDFSKQIVQRFEQCGVRFLFLDDIVRQVFEKTDYVNELQNVYMNSSRYVDLEHLPKSVWRETAAMVQGNHDVVRQKEKSVEEKEVFAELAGYQAFLIFTKLAAYYGQTGDGDAYERFLEEALKQGAFRIDDLILLALVGLKLGKAVQGILKWADDLMQYASNAERTLFYEALAQNLINEKRIDEADLVFGYLSEPTCSILLAKGVMLRIVGRVKESIESIELALSKAVGVEENNQVFRELATSLYSSGEKEKASLTLHKITASREILPSDVVSFFEVSSDLSSPILTIGTAPDLVLNSLLDQFSRLGVVSDVLSKNANVVQGIPSVSGWYQFPDVRFQYKEHASLIDQEVQTTRWGTLVVVVADFDFVEEYANILQLVAHLKVESVFFYAATQLFNGVNTSCLFRHFEAESIIISFREMSLRT